MTEGRKAFLDRVAGIEAGSECERLAPLLSKLVDGEASAADLTTLRPHLRTCLACRASLREYRQVPATAAALVPAAAVTRPDRPWLEAAAAWFQKTHSVVEMASAQKVAAVAASTAALAGGGAVTVQQIEHRADRPKPAAAKSAAEAARPLQRPTPVASPPPIGRAATPPAPSPAELRRARKRERRLEAERHAREIERQTPQAQQEFDPAFAADEPAAAPAASTTSAAPKASQPTRSGGGAEEFAP